MEDLRQLHPHAPPECLFFHLTRQVIAKKTFVNSHKKAIITFLQSRDSTRKIAFVQQLICYGNKC